MFSGVHRTPFATSHGGATLAPFHRAVGEEWCFDGTRVLLNGRDVTEMLDPDEGEIGVWCGLVEALGEYQDWAFEQQAPQRGKLHQVVNGVQEQVLIRLRRVYEEKMGGMAIRWGDGEFWINNINLRAMVAMYRARPTEKARTYLEGIRKNLALILTQPTATPHGARVEPIVRDIYQDLCDSLAATPIDRRCLPPGNRDRRA